MNDKQRPKVGVGVWLRNNGRVLLGRRLRGAEPGTWCPPGGGVEMLESAAAAAIRETKEETGLDIREPKFIAYIDDIFPDEQRHWITLYYVADAVSQFPFAEQEEIEEWAWFEWGKLPEPLFGPTRNFLKTGYNPINF